MKIKCIHYQFPILEWVDSTLIDNGMKLPWFLIMPTKSFRKLKNTVNIKIIQGLHVPSFVPDVSKEEATELEENLVNE